MPFFLSDREFLTKATWKWLDEKNILLVTAPTETERQVDTGDIRAKFSCVIRMKKLNDRQTRLEYAINPDSGMAIPKFLAKLYLTRMLSYVENIQLNFQVTRPLAVWGVEDGKIVGSALLNLKTDGNKIEQFIDLFRRFKGLEELEEKYNFFPVLLEHIVSNKLRPSSGVSTTLVNLDVNGAETIGKALALSLVSN